MNQIEPAEYADVKLPLVPARVRRSIERREKEGRGQGRGAAYRPWRMEQERRGSKSLSTRLWGWKAGREHHLSSKLALHYWALLEWSPKVLDIRENYPLLPIEATLIIASELGVQHPRKYKTGEPEVMLTDFVVTTRGRLGRVDQARSVRYRSSLLSKKQSACLEIERRYWAARRIDWGLVTDDTIPRTLVENVLFVYEKIDLQHWPRLTPRVVRDVAVTLSERVVQGGYSLVDLATWCDEKYSLQPGDSLTVAYHLIARRCWSVDLSRPLKPAQPIRLLGQPDLRALGQHRLEEARAS